LLVYVIKRTLNLSNGQSINDSIMAIVLPVKNFANHFSFINGKLFWKYPGRVIISG